MDPFKYREIRGLFSARLPDTGDSDELPDRVMLNGYGTLTPNFRGGSVVFTEVGEYVIPRARPVRFVDGHLMTEVLEGEESVLQPLFLEVTVDERANQEWSWTLSFESLQAGPWGEEISHPALSFPVPDGDTPLELSTVATSVIRAANFITRGVRGPAGDTGPGITAITASTGTVHIEWEGGAAVDVDVPTVPGPQGVGITDAMETAPGSIAFTLDDGTTTSPVPLPPGPIGPEGPYGGTEVTDPQVASWVNNLSTQTGLKIDEAYRTAVSVREYGAMGDGVTDDTSSVQAALDAGSSVYFPPGHYRLTGNLLVPDGAAVSGADSATVLLDWSSGTSWTADAFLSWAPGALNAAHGLAVDVETGDASIQVATGHDFAPGDFIRITADEVVFGEAVKAEFQRVRDVDSDTLYLSGPAFDTYRIADQGRIERAHLTTGALRGVTIRGKGVNPGGYGDNGVYFGFSRDVYINDVHFEDVENRCLHFDSVAALNVSNTHFRFAPSHTPLQYGISLNGATQMASISGCSSWNDRHMVTTSTSPALGGSEVTRGVPRVITITGCVAHGSWQCPIDTHRAGEYLTVTGNALTSEFTAIKARGSHTLITGNVLIGKPTSQNLGTPSGVRIGMRCEDIQVTGNMIRGFYAGINIDTPDGDSGAIVISDNTVIDCFNGIDILGATPYTGIRVAGNAVRATEGGFAVRLTASVQGLEIFGNTLTGGHTGIYCAIATRTLDHTLIQGNSLRGQSSRAMWLANVSDGLVSGNIAPGLEIRFTGESPGVVTGLNLANVVDTSTPGVDQR